MLQLEYKVQHVARVKNFCRFQMNANFNGNKNYQHSNLHRSMFSQIILQELGRVGNVVFAVGHLRDVER